MMLCHEGVECGAPLIPLCWSLNNGARARRAPTWSAMDPLGIGMVLTRLLDESSNSTNTTDDTTTDDSNSTSTDKVSTTNTRVTTRCARPCMRTHVARSLRHRRVLCDMCTSCTEHRGPVCACVACMRELTVESACGVRLTSRTVVLLRLVHRCVRDDRRRVRGSHCKPTVHTSTHQTFTVHECVGVFSPAHVGVTFVSQIFLVLIFLCFLWYFIGYVAAFCSVRRIKRTDNSVWSSPFSPLNRNAPPMNTTNAASSAMWGPRNNDTGRSVETDALLSGYSSGYSNSAASMGGAGVGSAGGAYSYSAETSTAADRASNFDKPPPI